MDEYTLVVTEHCGRLDKYLAQQMPFSRSFLQHAIARGDVRIDGKLATAKTKLQPGQTVVVCIQEPAYVDVQPEEIPLDIVYQDRDIAVINKPQGMVVHPAPGNYTGTLVNAALYHIKDLSGINGQLRPGIVHRLDKDTSGLLVIAKNDAAHASLAAQIQSKRAARTYLALIYGGMKEDALRVEQPIGRHKTDRKKMAVVPDGRYAATRFVVEERFDGYTLVRAELETGRTHQIRVHLLYAGHSIVGDPVYGRRQCPFAVKGQLLHAYALSFDHPATGERMTFRAPLPDYFARVLETIRKNSGEGGAT